MIDVLTKKVNLFWIIIDYLSFKIGIIAGLYEQIIGQEYVKEIETFNLEKKKNILHIGTGPYPLSAIKLSRLNDVKIVSIDRNIKYAELAKKIIKKQKLEGKVLIDTGDATKYPIGGFDLIIVSACISQKIPVLEHIFNESNTNCNFIIRETVEKFDELLSFINQQENVTYMDELLCKPYPAVSWKSILCKIY